MKVVAESIILKFMKYLDMYYFALSFLLTYKSYKSHSF